MLGNYFSFRQASILNTLLAQIQLNLFKAKFEPGFGNPICPEDILFEINVTAHARRF